MSGSTAGNPDHTFSKTSQPETAPGKQTLHSLEIKEGEKAKVRKQNEAGCSQKEGIF